MVAAFKALLEACSRSLNIPLEDMPNFAHAFSCEKEPSKRGFLREVCPDVENLYNDALAHEEFVSARFVSAGFPCDDASPLHPGSSSEKNRMCVAEAQ